MKQIIAIFFLVLTLLAGCSQHHTETQPTRETPDITEAIIATEVSESSTIPDDTKADVPPADDLVAVEIDYAPEDYCLHPENYEVYEFADLEYGRDAIVIPDAKVYNFKFFTIDINSLYMNGEYVISEILHTCDAISPEKPFVTRIYIAGPGSTHYGVSFLDESGNQYSYVIFESGKDGRFMLEPF